MWFILAIIGYAILAIVAMMDKYLLSQAKLKPALYTFYSTIFVLPVLLLIPFGVSFFSSSLDWIIALVSGFAFAAALWAMFISFEKSEVSHIGPLIGAATPLFVLLFGRLFLDEKLTGLQIAAIVILIIGSLIISFEKSKKNNGWHIGILWGILSGLFFALSHVSAKYLYDGYDFMSGFVWTRAAIGLAGVFILFHRDVFYKIFHKSFFEKIKAKFSPQNNLLLVGIDKVLGVVGVVIIQYAIAIGSVSLVNALNGLQYAILVIIVLLFTKLWPKKFKEEYNKGEIAQEILAVIIILFGLALLYKQF